MFLRILNNEELIVQVCMVSSQETVKKIQELSKTNILEPLSFQAFLPLSLQVPAAKRLGCIREAQTITTHACSFDFLIPSVLGEGFELFRLEHKNLLHKHC